ncbi:unnamed protein product, partial [Brenthis ino]
MGGRLSCACAVQESSSVALCGALAAADRALEAYDVLLALAETAHAPRSHERRAAELVARRLLARLRAAPAWGAPLLSPGPWHDHHRSAVSEESGADEGGEEGEVEGEGDGEQGEGEWSAACEAALRAHAARLKRDTVALRHSRPPPALYSPHDMDEEADPRCVETVSMAEMEAAVVLQEMLVAKENRATERAAALLQPAPEHKGEAGRRRRRERHWLDARASETDL